MRTIKAWAVVKAGRPLYDGFGSLLVGKKQRAKTYLSFLRSRKQYGLEIVPCTVTYENPGLLQEGKK